MTCKAPKFEAKSGSCCAFLNVLIILSLIVLGPLAFLPCAACKIKQLVFRMKYCMKGNSEDIDL